MPADTTWLQWVRWPRHRPYVGSCSDLTPLLPHAPQEEQLHGRLVVLGTPGSESSRLCCKARLLEQGAFAGIDAVLALHPASPAIGCCVAAGSEGPCQWLEFRFRGAAAADAAVLAYWALASGARGVLNGAGRRPCEPSSCSESQYVLLADNDAQLQERRRAAEDVLLGTAKATGCLLECRFGKPRPWPVFNTALEQLFVAQLHKPGVASAWFPCCCGRWCGAWSDWGSVSRAMPCLRATYPVPGAGGGPHSRSFAAAAATPPALRATLDAAVALAATAAQILGLRDIRDIEQLAASAHPAHH
ncbi:hypothetical protein V5799_003851 [Amblyomma americanum]|uniref:Uncharacterized protein n=1 Tax=Amblyomma americanum TaxID=6943 RepID=A0AAQ4D7S7_AMBAM